MESMIGTIAIWPGHRIPNGWLPCDGRKLTVAQYGALYLAIGGAYGENIKEKWFLLPDLRNTYPVGAPDINQIGKRTGANDTQLEGTAIATFTITEKNLPSHTHEATFSQSVGPSGFTAAVAIPVDSSTTGANGEHNPDNTTSLARSFSGVSNTVRSYSKSNPNTTLKPFNVNLPAVNGSVVNKTTGGGEPVRAALRFTGQTEIKPPSVSLNFIICVHGFLPTFD